MSRTCACSSGVSVGSVYQYFSHRDSILNALQDREFERALSLIQDVLAFTRLANTDIHLAPVDVEHLVRLNWAQGVHKFFITDDNFARNKEWEVIFDRLIELREEHSIPLGLMIQVDTLCHRIPNFIDPQDYRRHGFDLPQRIAKQAL